VASKESVGSTGWILVENVSDASPVTGGTPSEMQMFHTVPLYHIKLLPE
jgi:hypothetical protein